MKQLVVSAVCILAGLSFTGQAYAQVSEGQGSEETVFEQTPAVVMPLRVVAKVTFTESMSLGFKSDAVVILQAVLGKHGFLTMPDGVAYGYYGPRTKAAVGALQLKYNIVKSTTSPGYGRFGPLTRGITGIIASTPDSLTDAIQTPAE